MHYEDTELWGSSMKAAQEVMQLCKFLPKEERFGISAQMSRSATSIPSNIAEGWTRESPKEKAWFMSVAQGSLAELMTQLLLCERVGWLSAEQLVEVRSSLTTTTRILSTLRSRFREKGTFRKDP